NCASFEHCCLRYKLLVSLSVAAQLLRAHAALVLTRDATCGCNEWGRRRFSRRKTTPVLHPGKRLPPLIAGSCCGGLCRRFLRGHQRAFPQLHTCLDVHRRCFHGCFLTRFRSGRAPPVFGAIASFCGSWIGCYVLVDVPAARLPFICAGCLRLCVLQG